MMLLLCLCALASQAHAQHFYKWWVGFTDKNDSPYSTARPAEFLSARSIERRHKCGIVVTEEDLPVNPTYLLRLAAVSDVKIHNTSRWLNGATIICDEKALQRVKALPFVKNTQLLGTDQPLRNPRTRRLLGRNQTPNPRTADRRFGPMGYGYINVKSLNTHFLYDMGARGHGIWVAVMDGGFRFVDTIPMFGPAAQDGRIQIGYDFVERDRCVYESSTHGTSVLSVMAGDAPGQFVGAAPDATYFLLKTEESGYESPAEEANWIAGAEWADSIGVDIINASLGYTEFDEKSLSYTFDNLDGRYALGSRGAAIAARKGMIVCNAAGNSGEDPWKHIGIPSDAAGVVAVGATVSYSGSYAPFSSVGPSADGRIKPDLVAPGAAVVVASQSGHDIEESAGTSIATPILAGSLAALWSAYPDATDQQILDAVFKSSDQTNQPDAKRGYGQPDLWEAWLRLGGFHTELTAAGYGFYDRVSERLRLVQVSGHLPDGVEGTLLDAVGRPVWGGPLRVRGGVLQHVEIESPLRLPSGVYYLRAGGLCFVVAM
jgi:serine protease AprX